MLKARKIFVMDAQKLLSIANLFVVDRSPVGVSNALPEA